MSIRGVKMVSLENYWALDKKKFYTQVLIKTQRKSENKVGILTIEKSTLGSCNLFMAYFLPVKHFLAKYQTSVLQST